MKGNNKCIDKRSNPRFKVGVDNFILATLRTFIITTPPTVVWSILFSQDFCYLSLHFYFHVKNWGTSYFHAITEERLEWLIHIFCGRCGVTRGRSLSKTMGVPHPRWLLWRPYWKSNKCTWTNGSSELKFLSWVDLVRIHDIIPRFWFDLFFKVLEVKVQYELQSWHVL
jgi:hypothetical protein